MPSSASASPAASLPHKQSSGKFSSSRARADSFGAVLGSPDEATTLLDPAPTPQQSAVGVILPGI